MEILELIRARTRDFKEASYLLVAEPIRFAVVG